MFSQFPVVVFKYMLSLIFIHLYRMRISGFREGVSFIYLFFVINLILSPEGGIPASVMAHLILETQSHQDSVLELFLS